MAATANRASSSDTLIVAVRDVDGRTRYEFCRHVDTSQLGFEVRDLPGKGYGAIALKSFSTGERILSEPPLVAWTTRPDTTSTAGRKLHDFAELRTLVNALDAPSREAFLALADNHADPCRTLPGIWNTNSIKTEDVMGDSLAEAKDGLSRTAIFATLSRFNHACVPNCFPSWNSTLGRLTVHALREIAPGEELCIAYVAGAEAGARLTRQALLRQKYLFTCACATCSLSGDALASSDGRQTRLAAIHRDLSSWPESQNDALVGVAAEQLELMREEGLAPVWSRAGVFLVVAHLYTRGEYGAAAEWARQGAAAARTACGEDSSAFRRFEQYAKALGAAAGEVARGAGDEAAGEEARGDQEATQGAAAAHDSSNLAVTAEAAATANAAATAAAAVEAPYCDTSDRDDIDSSDDEDDPPVVPTYVRGVGSEIYERGEAADWVGGKRAGPRILTFQLVSHRQRFAHRLWPAARMLARYLDDHPELCQGRRVLEIGAGAALPSVIASLLGARALVVSDWPDKKMLSNMRANLRGNVTPDMQARALVVGYNWRHPPQQLLGALEQVERRGKQQAGPLGGIEGGGGRRGNGGTSTSSGEGISSGFELILLSDLLYECEHEPILKAVSACLLPGPSAAAAETVADAGGTDALHLYPRALVTYQCHDRIQAHRQAEFFQLAAQYGLTATRLMTVEAPVQFDESDGDDEEEGIKADDIAAEEDVTRQVQLWELACSI